MTPNQELELKLDLDGSGGAPERLLEALTEQFGQGKSERLTSIYFDTPEHALREAGLSLRIRKKGKSRIQTIKAGGKSAGLFDRQEWERPVAGDTPDLDGADKTPLGRALRDGRGLSPVFETDIRRRAWTLQQAEGQIEVAVDRGSVQANGDSAAICELELELKSGQPAALLALARSLERYAPMRLGAHSKSDRGYALLRGGGGKPAHAGPMALEATMTAAEGFQTIARACIRQFALNEPLVATSDDPEALHQARIGLRRLRSAVTLFKPLGFSAHVLALNAELKSMASATGRARNLDVLMARMAADPDADPDLLAVIEAAQETARAQAAAALAESKSRRLVLGVAVAVQTGVWSAEAAPARDRSITKFAAKALTKRRHTLKKRGEALAKVDNAHRHRARIAGKTLRYAAEFFVALPLGGADDKDKFIKKLKALQHELGELNDIVVGHGLIAELAEGASPHVAYVAGLAAGAQAAERDAILKRAEAAYDDLMSAEPYWD